MTSHSHSFKQALTHRNRPLANLYTRIEQQQILLSAIRKNLPNQLAEHARHCVATDKKLLLYTDSSAWASQLRFYAKTLLNAVEPITRHRIEILQIKVSEPVDVQRTKPKHTAIVPDIRNIAMIEESVTESDEPLNRALKKLSATLRRLSESSPDSLD
ncbi:MAG: DciA family protein [Gammaproteobacteria bacterium]